MTQVQYIKEQFEKEGKTIRAISRSTGLSQQTISKYVNKTDWNDDKLPQIKPERHKVLGSYIPFIDEWLENDRKEPRKQHHTAQRIHNRLVKEHKYPGCYTTVSKYVRKKKALMRVESTMPTSGVNDTSPTTGSSTEHTTTTPGQVYTPGQVTTPARTSTPGFLPIAARPCHGEIDFGEFKYYDKDGVSGKGHALTITFPFSNGGFTQVFRSENQECLLEGMKSIFYHIGGVPIRIKADNMTTAVSAVKKGRERDLTDGFRRFMLHHRFEADFCNPAAGNEKGNVENKVGYSRRNLLVPVPTIIDFDTFNKELLKACDKDLERKHYVHKDKTIAELWQEERKKLLALPEYEYHVFRYETHAVDKYGFVTIDTNKYGIPPELHGQKVLVKIFAQKVEIYYDHSLLKAYARSYERSIEVMDFTQYLNTLQRKPGALPYTRFWDQIPMMWRAHLIEVQGKERKSALKLLSEIVRDGNLSLCDEVMLMAMECGRSDIDSIRQCYLMMTKQEYHPKPLTVLSVPILDYKPDLGAYDDLCVGGESHE